MLRIRRANKANIADLTKAVEAVFSRIAQNTLTIAKQNTPI